MRLVRVVLLVAVPLSMAWTLDVHAYDLVPEEVDVIRVGPCDYQIRFKVALKGGTKPATYRIGVYSVTRNRLLVEFRVKAHKVGSSLPFFVPSGKLACDNVVQLQVDDLEQVAESNEANNGVRKKWEPPGKSSVLDNCPTPTECP